MGVYLRVLIATFLPAAAGKLRKGTPLKGKRVSFRKKRTCRIFLNFNILSPLRIPHSYVLTFGAHERGFVNWIKGILSPASRTVAVISFEMKLKS